METKQGVIEKIEKSEGTSKISGKPYLKYTYTIGGMLYSTFDIGIGESFKVGDSVVMEGEQKGKYWNMKSMKYADAPVPIEKPGQAAITQPQASKREFEAHLSIEQVRTNALDLAMKRLGPGAVTLFEAADKIANWILTGKI